MAALLVCLGPLGAVHALSLEAPKAPCLQEFGQSFELKSPDGRLKLVVTLKKGEEAMPRVYELRLSRGAKTVWTLPFGDVVSQAYTWLAPDGRAVVLMRPDGELVLLGARGQVRKSWPVRPLLSEAEEARFPRGVCTDGPWSQKGRFAGNFFELEVPPTAVLAAHPEGHKPPVLRVDLTAATLKRDEELPLRKDFQVIQTFNVTSSPEVRLRMADELLGRSQMAEHLKGRELNFFWNNLLLSPKLQPPVLYRMAVEAVAAYGTEGEVRALMRMPGQIEERDAAVLQVLDRKLPEEAGEYALRMLEGRHPGAAVRQQAVKLLMNRQGEAMALGVELALRDSDNGVRRLAMPAMLNAAEPLRYFEQALGFCKDPDPAVQYAIPRFVLRAMSREDTRQGFIELMRRDEPGFQIGQCPDVSLVLGALSDKAGDRVRALELFARGVKGLESPRKEDEPLAPALRQEARLQLALEAEKNGQRAEAERYARLVLADPAKSAPVCAPEPIAHEVPWLSGCLEGKEAQKVARELLGRLKSKRRGG